MRKGTASFSTEVSQPPNPPSRLRKRTSTRQTIPRVRFRAHAQRILFLVVAEAAQEVEFLEKITVH